MKWKYVINCNDKTMTLDQACKIAELTGYRFVYWNWKIWFILNGKAYHSEIQSEDLI